MKRLNQSAHQDRFSASLRSLIVVTFTIFFLLAWSRFAVAADKSTLGDYVWLDADQDGLPDPGKGINGVKILIYQDDGDGIFEPNQDRLVITIFTGNEPLDADGDNTNPGEAGFYDVGVSSHPYFVQVVASNFAPGGALEGLVYSGDAAEIQPDGSVLQRHDIPVGQIADIDDADFGFYPIHYILDKQLNTAFPIRVDVPISFTIRITNTGTTTIQTLPLSDTYDTEYLQYLNAVPASDDNKDDGRLDWRDVTLGCGDIGVGKGCSILVNFTTRAVTSSTVNLAQSGSITSSAVVSVERSTAVEFAEQSVVYAEGKILLHWRTENERAMLGFHVWRRSLRVGSHNQRSTINSQQSTFNFQLSTANAWVRLTEEPILALYSGQSQGADYSYEDQAIDASSQYEYGIEVLSLNGQSSPGELMILNASPNTQQLIYLPLVNR